MIEEENQLKDQLSKLIDDKKLTLCVECGKCVAGCPLAEMHESFSYDTSARGVIKKVLMGFDTWKNREFWFCLGCEVCARSCPAGVKFAEFIEAARQMAISENVTEHSQFCERCGRSYLSMPSLEYARGTLEEKKANSQFLDLCPECRRRDFAERVKPLPAGKK